MGLLLLWGVAWRQTQGSTLTAPCAWGILSTGLLLLLVLAQAEVVEGRALGLLRYAAGVSTYCPLMAVLGAKRPQHRGWQWVVLSLWLVVVSSAGQNLVAGSLARIELPVVWKLFLCGLIALGPLNYWATSNWLSALLVAAGQGILMGEFLGWGEFAPWRLPTALVCFFLGALWPWLRNRRMVNTTGSELAARWFALRDGYGAFWGLRVMQRVNETAELRQWPVRLTWQGLENVAGASQVQLSTGQAAEIESTLDTLLRRFLVTSRLGEAQIEQPEDVLP